MKKILIFIGFVFLVQAFQCESPEPAPSAEYSLNFKALYDGKPLVINGVNKYNGKNIRFTRLGFFLHNPVSNNGGSITNLSTGDETKWVDFTPLDDSATAKQGVTMGFQSENAASFNNISFTLGLPQNINSQRPNSFKAPSALSETQNYWDAWQSFIFTKIEASIDRDNNGTFETGITLHTGEKGAVTGRDLSFNKAFIIGSGANTVINFDFDVNKFIEGINLENVSSSHNLSDTLAIRRMLDNTKNTITIR
jgi:hypothetical protein